MQLVRVRSAALLTLALSSLGLASTALASPATPVVHVLTLAGAPNSVATLRVTKPLTLDVALNEPEQRLGGGDGEFAAVVVRDARQQIIWAEVEGNVPGRRTAIRVPVGGQATLQSGRYTLELLSRRTQSIGLRVPGLPTDITLLARTRTSDRLAVLAFGARPATGIWTDSFRLDPNSVLLTQVSGSSGIGSSPSNGTSLCALPPSTPACSQPDELGSYRYQVSACVVVTCPVPTSYSQYTFRNYFGKTIPGLSVLSEQDEDAAMPSWLAVVAITSDLSAPLGHPSL
jgi:hypothetical protein